MFLDRIKDQSKVILGVSSGLGVVLMLVSLLITQPGIFSGLVKNKNIEVQAQEVAGIALPENRDPVEIKDLIQKQTTELQSSSKNLVPTLSENTSDSFKQSNIITDADKKRDSQNYTSVPGEYLLKVKAGQKIDAETLKSKTNISDIQIKAVQGLEGYYVLSSNILASEAMSEKDLIKNEQKPSTNIITLQLLTNSGLFEAAIPNITFSIDSTPNDTFYNSQWYLDNKGSGDYYGNAFTKSVDINYNEASDLGISCKDIKIAVLDTGVSYEHVDLKDTIGGLTPDYPKGYNALNGSTNANDDHYHGSHVAGIIAAQTNNNEGVAGICPGATIVPIKVLGYLGTGSFSNILSGLSYAVNNGADVINMSLGGEIPANDPAYIPVVNDFQNLVNQAKTRGATVVVASGNSGINLDGVSIPDYLAGRVGVANTSKIAIPASLENTITVGASDREQKVANFSNYGTSKVELLAPGVNIYSSYRDPNKMQYRALSGTSMSSPMVAAAVGAMKSKNPALSYDQILNILQNTSDKNPDYLAKSQAGSLNLSKALVKAKNQKATIYAFNDKVEVKSNTSTELSFLSNDLVPNSLGDFIPSFTQPKNGKVVSKGYPATITAIYTPNANFTGKDSFTYTLQTRQGEQKTAIVEISVVNLLSQPPLAKNALFKVETGGQRTIIDIPSLVSSESGVDPKSVFIEETAKISNAWFGPDYNNEGIYIYSNQNRNLLAGRVYYDQIAYSVLGKNGTRSNYGYITFEVTRGNFGPDFNGSMSYNTPMNTPINIDILSKTTDLENDTVSISSAYISTPLGSDYPGDKIDIVNGSLVYTPPTDMQNFVLYIYFTLKDARGATTEDSIFISATPQPQTYDYRLVTANNKTYSVYEGDSISIDAFDLVTFAKLSNANCASQKPIFEDMVITRQPTQGTLTITPTSNLSSCSPIIYNIVYKANDNPSSNTKSTDSFEFRLGARSFSPNVGTVSFNIFDKSQISNIKTKSSPTPVNIYTGNYVQPQNNIKFSDLLEAPMPTLNPSTFTITKKTTNSGIFISRGFDYANQDVNSLYFYVHSSITLAPGQTLTDSFEFTISGENAPISLPIRVNLVLNKGNSMPITKTDYVVVPQGGSILIDVLANDTDADGDPLTITRYYGGNDIIVLGGSYQVGKREIVTVNGKQYLKYTNTSTDPDVSPIKPGDEDSYTSYVVTDGKSPTDTRGDVRILVNAAPVITGQINKVDTLATTKIDMINVVIDNFNSYAQRQRINYTFPNYPKSEIDYDSISFLSNPTSGTIAFDKTNLQFVYTPNSGVTNINEKIQVKIKDVWGAESTGYINLNSNPPVTPTANDDNLSLDEATSVSIDLLANDTSTDQDIKNSQINILAVPKFGSATVDTINKKINYVQNKDITSDQVDEILYTITDTKGLKSNAGRISLNIKDLNLAFPAPVVRADNFTVLEGDNRTFDLVANDTFKNQDITNLKSVIITSQPRFGIVDNDPKLGSVIYTQTQLTDKDLIDTFKYKLQDVQGLYSNEITVTVIIKNITQVVSDRTDQNLVFKNKTSGSAKVWQIDGSANQISDLNLIDSSNNPMVIPNNYRLAIVKDTNADSKPDFVFENQSTRKVETWSANQNIVTQKSILKTINNNDYILPIDFQIVGVDDFNRDGRADFLIFNSKNGKQTILYINNNQVISSSDILINGTPYLLRGWQITSVSDFNGDSKPDILIYNPTTGEQIMWMLDNQNKISTNRVLASGSAINLASSTGWKISSVADFNGDGKKDLLWFNYFNNRQMLWTLNGSNVTLKSDILDSSGKTINPAGWKIVATSDFNLDKKSDIVLQNSTTGDIQIWYMNGEKITNNTSVLKSAAVVNPGNSWVVN